MCSLACFLQQGHVYVERVQPVVCRTETRSRGCPTEPSPAEAAGTRPGVCPPAACSGCARGGRSEASVVGPRPPPALLTRATPAQVLSLSTSWGRPLASFWGGFGESEKVTPPPESRPARSKGPNRVQGSQTQGPRSRAVEGAGGALRPTRRGERGFAARCSLSDSHGRGQRYGGRTTYEVQVTGVSDHCSPLRNGLLVHIEKMKENAYIFISN